MKFSNFYHASAVVAALAAAGGVPVVRVRGMGQEVDCYADAVAVTNQTTCDEWCGGEGKGAYNGMYSGDPSRFTGLECTCDDEHMVCKGTYVVPDCYEVGVKNKATCDDWCPGSVGAFTSVRTQDNYAGHSCECTDKNDAQSPPATQWCEGTYTTPSCFGVGVTNCAACESYCNESGVGEAHYCQTGPDGTSDATADLGCKCGVANSPGTASYACTGDGGPSAAVGTNAIINYSFLFASSLVSALLVN